MKYFLRFFILTVAAGLLIFGGCKRTVSPEFVYPQRLQGEPEIRVRVLATAQPLTLQVSGAYDLQVVTVNGETINGQSEQPVTIGVKVVENGVKLGKDIYRRARLTPRAGTILKIVYHENDQQIEKTFPGTFIFTTTNGKERQLNLIIELPIEQYLLGVIAGEMPLGWAPDALKAQAVAARTYALYHIKTRTQAAFDVVNDVGSQVWNPQAANDPRARAAINSTRGEILNDNFRLFPTYFCGDCGGATATGKYIFPAADLPALQGVKCPYLKAEPWKITDEQWKITYSKDAITAAMAKHGLSNGKLLRLALLNEKNEPLTTMGRVYYVKLFNENGIERTIPADAFRKALGRSKHEIASTLMQMTANTNNTITFEGRGNGHGVGLCQHGAMYMAGDQQRDYQQILRHYYPTATLLKVW